MIVGLPYDAEVEYLESTGTQWIDTGIRSASNLVVTIDVLVYSGFSFGTYVSPYQFAVDTSVDTGWWRIDGVGGDPTTHAIRGRRNVIVLRNQNALLNGEIVISLNAPSFSNGSSMFLFCANGKQSKLSGRVFSFSIKANDSLLLDFIPVRFTNEENQTEGAMYDRVTKQLFRNAGTGSFVLGPDVATPVMGLRKYPQIGGAA